MPNIIELNKKAVKAAIEGNWEEAVEINSQIIEKTPGDIKAKSRLGRAYLELADYTKAKKLLKEVLDKDPLNTTAKKNYELAKAERKNPSKSNGTIQSGIIKEPGTTMETEMEIVTKGITSNAFTQSEKLKIKVEKGLANVYKSTGELTSTQETLIGSLSEDMFKKLKAAKKAGGTFTAIYISGEDKKIKLLVKCSLPVFKSKKQDVKPYVKKGTIVEPDLELPEQ